MDYRKKGTLILSSLLKDLGTFVGDLFRGSSKGRPPFCLGSKSLFCDAYPCGALQAFNCDHWKRKPRFRQGVPLFLVF